MAEKELITMNLSFSGLFRGFGRKPEPLRGRIYISGTGRAGTTFLVQLLTRLGVDTGFGGEETTNVYFPQARAGFEKDIFDKNGPRVVKSPYLCDHVEEVLAAGIEIGHVIIPVRKFADAAESRRYVQRETTGLSDGASVAGGLWGTEKANEQAEALGLKFGNLIEALVRHEIPVTFLAFPRLAVDPDYLFEKICSVFPEIDRKDFNAAFSELSKPGLIDSFKR